MVSSGLWNGSLLKRLEQPNVTKQTIGVRSFDCPFSTIKLIFYTFVKNLNFYTMKTINKTTIALLNDLSNDIEMIKKADSNIEAVWQLDKLINIIKLSQKLIKETINN